MGDDGFEAFQTSIGTRVLIVENGLELELAEATRANEHAYSLIYHGPADHPLDQATYTFKKADGSTQPIFIVPVGPAPDGSMAYEAVFTSLPGHQQAPD